MAGVKSGEFRGKTIEAAISVGLAALMLSREDVEIEVIRPGSRGVLGIGAEDAVVRLTEQRTARPEAPARSEPQPQPAPQPRPEAKQTAARPEPTPKTPARAEVKTEPAKAPPPAASGEKARTSMEQGREFLNELLAHMGLQATVEIGTQTPAEAEEGDQVPVLNIVGDDLGVLIGRQNEVLSALEFITRLAVNQQSHTRSQFAIDVNNYRAKRAESLRKLAFRMADQAIQSGRTASLEPMPAAERRIIHLALRDHPKVFSQSVGEGDRRKVTVVLKKDA
jgi:spoIIIJ-associated protein